MPGTDDFSMMSASDVVANCQRLAKFRGCCICTSVMYHNLYRYVIGNEVLMLFCKSLI
jgi:hypothetical protein